MKVINIDYDLNSFGITERSLRVLRNALAEKIDHKIAVVEAPTSDLCCGYFIFDQYQAGRVVFTGDGFRTDGGGEGGAGYKSARALFAVFNIRVIPGEAIENFDEIYAMIVSEKIEARLVAIAQKYADLLYDTDFREPSKERPQYVRN